MSAYFNKTNMDDLTIRSIFESKKAQHNIDFELKKEQITIAASIYNKRNCLGFLPTGFGKTMCFVLNSFLCDKSITLIVSPLLSLIDNQIDTLTKWNFRAAKISGEVSQQDMHGICNGDYSFVFSSPEAILKPIWRKTFLKEVWQKNLCCIVFDEAHCLSEWGDDFRPDYREMSQLRSFFNVPILALTATSTTRVKEDLFSSLHLDVDNTDIVSISSNRPYIFICCQKKQSIEYEKEFDWLLEHIKSKGKFAKKTIIYCRSIDVVSEIFICMKDNLGEHAYADRVVSSSNLLVEMFHKCTHEDSKSRILSSFSKPESIIRCVVATVALGMGIDIPDIDMIVHIGCPKSVISYWHEAGRCARDGRQGFSLILYDNFTAALKTTEKNMSEIVKNNSKCIRHQILQHFIHVEANLNNTACDGCIESSCLCSACKCCNICASKCPCSAKSVISHQKFISV